MIIGNLTSDPTTKTVTTSNGVANVCNFTVAVNDHGNEAQFFRCTAWNKLADNCAKYLSKGRKVCVVGSVSASTYRASDGSTRVSINVSVREAEFLSSRNDANVQSGEHQSNTADSSGFTAVEADDLPF